jgi:hypothetical protein
MPSSLLGCIYRAWLSTRHLAYLAAHMASWKAKMTHKIEEISSFEVLDVLF